MALLFILTMLKSFWQKGKMFTYCNIVLLPSTRQQNKQKRNLLHNLPPSDKRMDRPKAGWMVSIRLWMCRPGTTCAFSVSAVAVDQSQIAGTARLQDFHRQLKMYLRESRCWPENVNIYCILRTLHAICCPLFATWYHVTNIPIS